MKKISGNTGSVFLVIISAMFWAGSGLGAQLFLCTAVKMPWD